MFSKEKETLFRLMGSYKSFSGIIADVFPPLHFVITRLHAPDLQAVKKSAFIEVITLTEDQLIKCS